MGQKYRVSQNDCVFGHYYAHSPKEAVEKAYQKNQQYGAIDISKPFYLKKGNDKVTVTLGE